MRILAPIALAIVALAFAAPALAENPCDVGPPHDVLDVRGFTWSGMLLSIQDIPEAEQLIRFRVDRVYANAGTPKQLADRFEAGRVFLLRNDACAHVFGLSAGRRYLMSTDTLYPWHPSPGAPWTHTIASSDIVAWELRGSGATIVNTLGPRGKMPDVFVQRQTLAEAVGLVAPGAAMPSTDTASRSDLTQELVPWLPLLAGVLSGLLFFVRPRTGLAAENP